MKSFLKTIILILFTNFNLFAQTNADFSSNVTSGCSPLSVKFTNLSTGNPTSFYWNFGNGQTSVKINPSATYLNPGSYTVILKVSDANGTNTITKTNFITVFSNPVADFSVNKNLECTNVALHFYDQSSIGNANIKVWQWNFGDGAKSSQTNPNHSYSVANKYSLTLIVTDENGCTDSKRKQSYIDIKSVKADFYANETEFCSKPASVFFSNLSSPSNTSLTYNWDFGDGNSSTKKFPNHKYQNTGSYTVKLTTKIPLGCEDKMVKTKYINVNEIKADFKLEKKDSCLPAFVKFTNQSTPQNGISYHWSFGDGATKTTKNAEHLYMKSKKYRVTLIINKGGCIDSISKSLYFAKPPDADFIADTTYHCKIPFKVNFLPVSTNLNSYKWDFGNGKTSTDKFPSSWYYSYGDYNVSLIVKDKKNCESKKIKRNYIISSPPNFSIKINPKSGCKPLTVNYIITDSSFIPLTNWKITSGDGQTLHSKYGKFIYQDTGIFTITITGKNSRGCQLTKTDKILVGIPPNADFQDFNYVGCNDTFLHFINTTNNSSPKADSFTWYFGDGRISNEIHPFHKYQDTGYMSVKLEAFFRGCPSIFTRDSMIYIYPPVAKIKGDKICELEELRNFNNSIGGNKWLWDFGDGSYDSTKNPSHIFNYGTYKIILKLTDTITKCIDYDSAEITVTKGPEDDFYFVKSYGCKGTEIECFDTSTANLHYKWSFGSNKYSYKKNPKYTFLNGGYHTITLTVTDSNNCKNKISKTDFIKVSKVNAGFTVSKTIGCLPFSIELKDTTQSVFPITQRIWYMGNTPGFYSYDRDTNYTYTEIPYRISQKKGCKINLKITDELGCTKTVSKIVTPLKPRANIILDKDDNCKQLKIKYSTKINDTLVYTPAQTNWYINNHPASNKQAFSETYKSDTSFLVKLILTDNYSCKDTAEELIDFKISPPVADFDYNILHSVNNCPPVIVDFYNKSKAGKYSIKSYKWEFGNNTCSSILNPSSTYTAPGLYSVSLIAEDTDGCIDTIIKPDIINVNGAIGNILAYPDRGCDSLECSFSAQTSSSIIEYYWNFGDGSISTDSFPEHTYTYAGTFKPLLILKDSLGCVTSIEIKDPIIIYKSPIADFDVKAKLTCLGQLTNFINKTTGEQKIQKYLWDLGDGSFSSNFEPSHLYSDTGLFNISLSVIDSAGCKDSITKPEVVDIYFDTIGPESSMIYSITHIDNPILDELLFSSNNDYDFMDYSIFRTNKSAIISSERKIFDILDTFIQDTVFSHLIPQCYYIKTTDYCFNKSNPSPLHCLIYLNVKPLSSGNDLRWTPYVGWDTIEKYEIYRKDYNNKHNFKLLNTVNGNTLNYLDTNVFCKENYFYRIKAFEKNGFNQTSWSNIDNVLASKTMYIDAIKLIRVSVENESVLIEWEKANLKFNHVYTIFRSRIDSNYKIAGKTDSTTLSFIDSLVETAKYSYYYHVKIQDKNCGHFGKRSNIGKSILLKVNKTELDEKLKLNWTDYIYWDEGVSYYEIEYLNENTNKFEIIAEFYKDSNIYYHLCNPFIQKHHYRVRAIQNSNPDIISNSNIAVGEIEPRVTIPNAFTPNLDGTNDVFRAITYGCKVTKMQIFNRWGEKLFESNQIDNNSELSGWDGKFENKICPLGVYYYQVFIESDDTTEMYKGSVTLLR